MNRLTCIAIFRLSVAALSVVALSWWSLRGFALSEQPAAELRLKIQTAAGEPAELLNPAATAWQAAQPVTIGLNRTPPLYATDPPASLDIPTAEVRLLRAGNALLMRLAWKDSTRDAAELGQPLPKPGDGPQIYKAPSQPNRFFDACAVMLPSTAAGASMPALQMGSTDAPVVIYFLDVVRGAAVMEAQGRGTTRRTGAGFPARAVYDRGGWLAVLEIPMPPPGTPLSFAIWNGSQNDRDGRKYFSVWHRVE